ncbi:MAG: O-antigen ligase family protein [Candidatus Korobacteraceae bacterium]|jgi:hypothetical protein
MEIDRYQHAESADAATSCYPNENQTGVTRSASAFCAWGLLGLLIGAVLAFGAVQHWSELAFELGATTLFIAWGLQQAWSRQFTLAKSGLYAPAVGFLLVVLAQIAFRMSAYQYASESSALLYIAYGSVLLLAIECLRDKNLRKRMTVALVGFGACYATFAIVQNLTEPRKLYWTIEPSQFAHTYGSYVSRNHYAGLMEMLVAIPLVLTASQLLKGGKRIIVGFAFVLMAGSIFLSVSRGGMFAFSLEALIFLVLLLRNPSHRKKAFAFIGMLALMIAFLGYASKGQVSDRMHDFMVSDRLAMTADTLRLWRERPLLGWGLGTFATVYPHVRSFPTNLLVDAAHNDYAQTLAETGIVGFAFTLWFIFVLCRKGAQCSRHWDTDWGAALSLGALLGCVGMLAHSFVDFNLQIPANAAFFYFFAGLATTSATRRHAHL